MERPLLLHKTSGWQAHHSPGCLLLVVFARPHGETGSFRPGAEVNKLPLTSLQKLVEAWYLTEREMSYGRC